MNQSMLTTGRAMSVESIKLCLTRAGLIFLCSQILACAHSDINEPLDKWSPEIEATSLESLQGKGSRSEEITVLVGFSGGGTRAATFAYGVLQELADTQIAGMPDSQSLLKEVDMISSVSAASFTAAYYGLYGDQIFFGQKKWLRSVLLFLSEIMMTW